MDRRPAPDRQPAVSGAGGVPHAGRLGRDGKRGSNRYERIPTALCGRVDLRTPADYAAYFLPQEPTAFPDGYFTAAGYARLTGIRGRTTYGILHLLEKLELIREDGMEGRSRRYRIEAKSDG